MLETRIAQGHLLKKVFDAIKEMVTDVNLECSTAGIQLQAMDSSHVSLVTLTLRDAIFDHFRCDSGRTLGLNMATVTKVFRLCGNEDAVTIRHEQNADTVSFLFESAGEDRVSDFDLKLMQIDQESLGVPESDFAVAVSMPAKQYQRVVTELGLFSDSVKIEVTPKMIRFSAQGQMGGGSTVFKPRAGNDDERVEISCTENVSLGFAVRYLSYFAKAAPLSNQVQLRMNNAAPLEVTFNLANDASLGHMKFFLAPKMDGNDDGPA